MVFVIHFVRNIISNESCSVFVFSPSFNEYQNVGYKLMKTALMNGSNKCHWLCYWWVKLLLIFYRKLERASRADLGSFLLELVPFFLLGSVWKQFHRRRVSSAPALITAVSPGDIARWRIRSSWPVNSATLINKIRYIFSIHSDRRKII